MDITLDWISIINITGLINGLFLSFVFFVIKRGKKVINRILSLLILSVASITIAAVLWTTDAYLKYPNLLGIFPKFYLAIGPLLYLYVLSLIKPDFKFNKKYLFHFIPLCFAFFKAIPFYLEPAKKKLEIYLDIVENPNLDFHFNLLLRFIHLSIYLILIAIIIKNHRKTIKNYFSNIDKYKITWMTYLIISFSIVLGLYIIFYLLWVFGNIVTTKYGKLISIWNVILLFWLEYKGIVQPQIFANDRLLEPGKKYNSSRLSEEQADHYLKKLIEIMKNRKPYLENEITLKELADTVGTSHIYLSQIINQRLKQNFYDFINNYRINEAKKTLENFDSFKGNILDIAFEVGFNSKSTFYSAFKKNTGLTPIQYKKKNN